MKDFSHVKSASQFVREMRQMFPKTKWKVSKYGGIRTERNNKYQYPYCPICYAAYKLTGDHIPNSHVTEAALKINLKYSFAESIVNAADTKIGGHIRRVMKQELIQS